MQRQVVVTISPEGEVEVKVQGHLGPACQDLTKDLENALGTTVQDKRTPEYHQAEQQDERQQAGR